VHCTKLSAEFEFGGHNPMQFCVDSNHMSRCNLSDHSITFARWRHFPSLLAQSLQSAVTRALQRVACSYDVGKISAGCLYNCLFYSKVLTPVCHCLYVSAVLLLVTFYRTCLQYLRPPVRCCLTRTRKHACLPVPRSTFVGQSVEV